MPATSNSKSNRAFVTALYRSLLNREPDERGMLLHLKTLQDGTRTPESLIRGFMESEEFRSRVHNIRFQEDGKKQVVYTDGVKQSGVYNFLDANPEVFSAHFRGAEYMGAANCRGSDFLCQEYIDFCDSLRHSPVVHRKMWEFAFIKHHLQKSGVVKPGNCGVGFGVGTEPLPSLFASLECEILATDAPMNVVGDGWRATNQHGASLDDIYHASILSKDLFDQRVSFQFADMNAIGDDIRDFDFCWSSCCFEHLGTIERGLDFVLNSVEKTLKIGGVACHTSEFNLTSNDETIESGQTVLFRRQDIERLIARLQERGHNCQALPFEPGLSFVDHLVDVPPFLNGIHLKIELSKYITTSFGIVVTRGR